MYPDDFTVVTMGSPILWDGLVLPDNLPAGLPQPDRMFDDDIVDRDRLRTHPHQELARLREVYGPDAVWWSDNAGNPVAYLPEIGIGYLDFDSRMPGSVDEAMGGYEEAGAAIGGVIGSLVGLFSTGGAAAVPASIVGGTAGRLLGKPLGELLAGRRPDTRSAAERAYSYGVDAPVSDMPLVLRPEARLELARIAADLHFRNPHASPVAASIGDRVLDQAWYGIAPITLNELPNLGDHYREIAALADAEQRPEWREQVAYYTWMADAMDGIMYSSITGELMPEVSGSVNWTSDFGRYPVPLFDVSAVSMYDPLNVDANANTQVALEAKFEQSWINLQESVEFDHQIEDWELRVDPLSGYDPEVAPNQNNGFFDSGFLGDGMSSGEARQAYVSDRSLAEDQGGAAPSFAAYQQALAAQGSADPSASPYVAMADGVNPADDASLSYATMNTGGSGGQPRVMAANMTVPAGQPQPAAVWSELPGSGPVETMLGDAVAGSFPDLGLGRKLGSGVPVGRGPFPTGGGMQAGRSQPIDPGRSLRSGAALGRTPVGPAGGYPAAAQTGFGSLSGNNGRLGLKLGDWAGQLTPDMVMNSGLGLGVQSAVATSLAIADQVAGENEPPFVEPNPYGDPDEPAPPTGLIGRALQGDRGGKYGAGGDPYSGQNTPGTELPTAPLTRAGLSSAGGPSSGQNAPGTVQPAAPLTLSGLSKGGSDRAKQMDLYGNSAPSDDDSIELWMVKRQKQTRTSTGSDNIHQTTKTQAGKTGAAGSGTRTPPKKPGVSNAGMYPSTPSKSKLGSGTPPSSPSKSSPGKSSSASSSSGSGSKGLSSSGGSTRKRLGRL